MNPYTMGLMVFLGAAAIAGALTPVVIDLAKRLGVLDRPAHRKATSMRVVPTLGGVAIVGGVWGVLLAASLLIPEIRRALFVNSQVGYVMAVVGGVMAMLGVIDDRFSLRPRTKLLIQALLGMAIVGYGFVFERISIPWVGTIELYQLAIPLTVIWFVGVTNALNLVDGIDGLASGVALVVAVTVAVIALMTGNVPALIVAAALAGACAGFLPYNFSPARIFLGDSGSLFLGASLAALSLTSSTKAAVAGSMLVPVFLLGYPTLDTLLVMTRRFLKGKPIFAGGRDHIHHRLLASGLTHGQSSLALYGFCAIFCLTAIGASTPYDQATMIGGLVVVIVIMILGSIHLGYFSEMTPQEMRRRRHEFQAVRYRFLLARAEMELAATAEAVLGSIRRIAADFGVHRVRIQMRSGGRTQRWSIDITDPLEPGLPESVSGNGRHVANGDGANGHASRLAEDTDAVPVQDAHSNGNGKVNGHANGNGHGHAASAGRLDDNGRLSGNGHAHGDESTAEAADRAEGVGRASEHAVIREKLRFPESRMTARIQMAANPANPDLKLEHRIYLSNALQVAGRRLTALAEQERLAWVAAQEEAAAVQTAGGFAG